MPPAACRAVMLYGIALVVSACVWTTAWGHSEAQRHPSEAHRTLPSEEKAFGKAADPATAIHTITVEMNDAMRFTPAELAVKLGQTVRFVVRNSGRTMHEMVLGTMKDLKAHAALMRKFPGMEHDEPYMVHVAPGTTGDMGWQFTKAGTFYYGCLIPGHFEAGMVGKITVRKEPVRSTRQ